MRILFVNQYYWPDSAATAQMLVDLCEDLAARGHEVHVLCSRGAYDDRSAARRPPRIETRNGVRIWRTAATGFGKHSYIGQAIDFLSFHGFVGLRTISRALHCDIVVTLTTPPLVGVYGWIAQLVSGVRHVSWVMDLHPDCEWELGIVRREQWFVRVADRLNRIVFRAADACVSLGAYMTGRLREKGVAESNIVEIPVWGHDLPTGVPRGTLRQKLGLGGKFVVMYSGNAGVVHTFDEICEAARRLRDDDRFRFLFIGGGRRLAEIKRFVKREKLPNVLYRGYLPRTQLADSLTTADVHLITLRPRLEGVSVPCKLYGIMAAGRPALFVGPAACETADAIRAADCGRTVRGGDVDQLVRTLRELADDAEMRRRLGENARAAFEQQYNRTACTRRWADLLESLMAGGRPA